MLFGAVHQRARSHAKSDGGIGLAMRDLCAKLADTILGQCCGDGAARIENDDAERLQAKLATFGEAGIDNLSCLVEGDAHGGSPAFE